MRAGQRDRQQLEAEADLARLSGSRSTALTARGRFAFYSLQPGVLDRIAELVGPAVPA